MILPITQQKEPCRPRYLQTAVLRASYEAIRIVSQIAQDIIRPIEVFAVVVDIKPDIQTISTPDPVVVKFGKFPSVP